MSLIPTSVDERRRFVKKQLAPLRGSKVFCPALGVDVGIEQKSIDEIAEKAAKSRKSTVAALNCRKLMAAAEYDGIDLPHNRQQKDKFNAIFMYKLKAELEDFGVVKIMVAVQEVRGMLYYSVTIPW